jgi:adenylate kinase family enzyme
MRPVFIMFCGLPGSGKSSMSRALKSVMPVIEEDGYLDDLVKSGAYQTYREAWLEKGQEAIDVCSEKLTSHARRDGSWDNRFPVDFVFDGINLTVEGRKNILALFPNHKRIAVYWDYPLQVIHARLRARQKRTGKEIPFSVVEEMKENYVFPTVEEGFDEVHAMTIPPLKFEDYT